MDLSHLPTLFAVVGLVVIAVGVAIWIHRQEQKLLAAMAAWAEAGDWSFRPERIDDPGHPFALFHQGHSRWSRYHAFRSETDVIPGWDEAIGIDVFQYHWAETHGTGKDRRTTHHHHLCALVDTGIALGQVAIRPEGWGDKIVGFFGMDDIDFEDPEFSSRFHVAAKEPRDAYELLDGAMMRFLCGTRGWRIETNGSLLLVGSGERVSPQSYEKHAAFARDVLVQLPRTMINAARARHGLPPVVEAGNAAAEARGKRAQQG